MRGADTNNFVLLMLKHVRADFAVNLEESMCVIMKRNTVLSGMAYGYYATIDMLVSLHTTTKRILRTTTCSENTQARRI